VTEGSRHSDGGVVVVRVEEEFENATLAGLVLILVDTGLKHFDCLRDHSIDEQAPSRLIASKGLIVPVLVKDHHLVDEVCLVCEGAKVPNLIELACPNGICIVCTLDTRELGGIPPHESSHFIKGRSVLLC
jgi:hypothetical protein